MAFDWFILSTVVCIWKNSQILIHWSSRWKKICLHAKMRAVRQRGAILWWNIYLPQNCQKLKSCKKRVVRSVIWNSMILTSLIMTFLPSHVETWQNGAFFISSILRTVLILIWQSTIKLCYALKMYSLKASFFFIYGVYWS